MRMGRLLLVAAVIWLMAGSARATNYLSSQAVSQLVDAVVAGELNRDPKSLPDLVTGKFNGSVTVLLGDGRFGFSESVTRQVGVGDFRLFLFDATGDGLQDVVVVPYLEVTGRNIEVLIGDGNGGLEQSAAETLLQADRIEAVSAGDLNGDNAPDLVLSDGVMLYTYLQTGDGGFQACGSRTVDPLHAEGSAEELARALELLVLQRPGDQLADVVASVEGPYGRTRLAHYQGLSGGMLADPNFVTMDEAAVRLAAADLDNRGELEIIATTDTGLRTFQWGAGGLGLVLLQNVQLADRGVRELLINDQNGDGYPDVVASVHFEPGFSGHGRSLLEDYGAELTVSFSLGDGSLDEESVYLQADAVGMVPYSLMAADFDRLQGEDLGSAISSSATPTGMGLVVSLLPNAGDGQYSEAEFYPRSSLPLYDPSDVVAVDLDDAGSSGLLGGGGRLQDLVVVDRGGWSGTPGLFYMLNIGGGFFDEYRVDLGTRPERLDAGDLNGDGLADVVVTDADGLLHTVLGVGSGDLQLPTMETGGTPRDLVLLDLDGDGVLDLAVSLATAGGGLREQARGEQGSLLGWGELGSFGGGPPEGLEIRYGLGDGRFTEPVYLTDPTIVDPWGVAGGDFDGDGRQDLAVANSGSNSVSVFLGDTPGSFLPALNLPSGDLPRGLVAGNFDGMPGDDLVVANSGSASVGLYLAGIDGPILAEVFPAGEQPGDLTAGLLNCDGLDDLVVTTVGSDSVSVLINTGTERFAPPWPLETGPAPLGLTTGWLDEVGRQDLAVANSGSGGGGTLSLHFNSDCEEQILCRAPTPDLPDLVSICSMLPFPMDAGPGYAHYQWNTGETSRSIVVQASQSFTLDLQVTDSTGCSALSSTAVKVLPEGEDRPVEGVLLAKRAGGLMLAWPATGNSEGLWYSGQSSSSADFAAGGLQELGTTSEGYLVTSDTDYPGASYYRVLGRSCSERP